MTTIRKLKRMLRGEVSSRAVVLETFRRARAARNRRRERSMLTQLDLQPARLREQFAQMSAAELLAHFQSRADPVFFPGIVAAPATAKSQRLQFPDQTEQLLEAARAITDQHSWPLLGLHNRGFGEKDVQWHSDPRSWQCWPLSYHADIPLIRSDGSDVRFVWELNRLGHFITLGRAFALTNDERFSAEFFDQLASWRDQNPVAMGVNWANAMEVALRSINLLTAFVLFSRAPQLNGANLLQLLKMFDQHGAHIERNLEFSHVATSNHYLSDVVGLFWLGLMVPELTASARWREFGWREMLKEMDKQILPDGAHYECSTGYHRFVLELFLYSFLLARFNGIDIEEKYWSKLSAMFEYVRSYLRPDGRAPLIGDSDSGQAMPLVLHSADDHAYLLALGAAVFKEPNFKVPQQTWNSEDTANPTSTMPVELAWILGEAGVRDYEALPVGPATESGEFRDAGTVVMRDNDLYLLLNAGGVGMKGRGSHRHNDALSIEVSAGGTAFIVDPGTYVYTGDLYQRHLFRSTAYHSTVQVSDREQRTILESDPFSIGDDGQSVVHLFKNQPEVALVIAEYYYGKPRARKSHRRTVVFQREKRYWLVRDEMKGFSIRDQFSHRFHCGPDQIPTIKSGGVVELFNFETGSRLLIVAQEVDVEPFLEERFSSTDYGAKRRSYSVCWRSPHHWKVDFLLVPVLFNEDPETRLQAARSSRR